MIYQYINYLKHLFEFVESAYTLSLSLSLNTISYMSIYIIYKIILYKYQKNVI